MREKYIRCRDCKHSYWDGTLRCKHPKIADHDEKGPDCWSVRHKTKAFEVCGRNAKLFEAA